jgi:spore germination protein YaaH
VGKILLFALLLFLGGYIAFRGVTERIINDFTTTPNAQLQPTITEVPESKTKTTEKTSIFVPYWTVNTFTMGSYDKVIYFGITADTQGINKGEPGYANLDNFLDRVGDNSNAYLTLRMLDQETNFDIIENRSVSKQVITETVALAKDKGFSGVVLNLELQSLPFESVIKNINTFVKTFYQETKNQNLAFAVTIYGDSFYRVRPFDIKTIGKHTDELMIMTYDFSKARGNPGPNFPLTGKSTYGYDLHQMIADYLHVVSREKLTVIFGLYGYDWQVDEKKNAVTPGKSLALTDIQGRFINACSGKQCTIKRDALSSETRIEYIDESEKNHIVWFEDLQSVKVKKEYLYSQGIFSFSYWAYSYF